MDVERQRVAARPVARQRLVGGNDARLIAAVRAGSDEAFAAIVRRHERALRRYATRLLHGSGHDPQDVVQDVFIRAHAALTGPAEREPDLKPWLFRMTRNRAIDVLRRRNLADASLDAEHAAEAVAPSHTEPAHAAGRREALRLVMGDLAALPEPQRDALLMRELDGKSHEWVAAQLGVTPQASRMLIVRARDNLVKSAAARDASCQDIRTDLADAHDARHRPSEHTRRHVRECAACRSYRMQLHDVRRRVALVHPGPAILGLLGAMKIGGAGVVASTPKAVAALTTAVLVTAGAAGVVLTQHPTLKAGDPAPRIIPGSGTFFRTHLVRGATLPPGTKQIEASLRLPPVKQMTSTVVRLTCPPGYFASIPVPREETDPAIRTFKFDDVEALGNARSIHWRQYWRPTPQPHTATARMGLQCSNRPQDRRSPPPPPPPPPRPRAGP